MRLTPLSFAEEYSDAVSMRTLNVGTELLRIISVSARRRTKHQILYFLQMIRIIPTAIPRYRDTAILSYYS